VTTARNPIHSVGRGHLAAGLAALVITIGPGDAPVPDVAASGDRPDLARPHLLTDAIGDVIVRIRGGAACTGTPITGTTYVVTAAHCVLDDDGHVSGARTVQRSGVEYTSVSVLVDAEYHNSPLVRFDVAVLVMDKLIPGPSALIGDSFPTDGPFTLAGHQPLDTDGSLLRGTRADNRPRPKGVTQEGVEIETAPAGCVHPASDLEITTTRVKVPCGLIPTSSGGGLFVENDGELILVGVLSTVAPDLAYNGVAPLSALHKLLDNPTEYAQRIPT
jgi:Trypsin-like peptidase domain